MSVSVKKITYENDEIHHLCCACHCRHVGNACEHDAQFLVGGVLELCRFHLKELGHAIILQAEDR